MPQEDRRIIFDSDETYKALYSFCAKREMSKPPPGVVTAIEFDKEDERNILVTFKNPNMGDEAQVIDYTHDFVAAALMVFCRGIGIPLPKQARKSVILEEGKLCLRVQV